MALRTVDKTMAIVAEAEVPVSVQTSEPNPALINVLRKYGIADANGNIRTFQDAAGTGPILDPEVIRKFMELDSSRNLKKLDWMLLQAGGGKGAMAGTERHLKNMRETYLDRRMEGLDNAGKPTTPLTREQAEAAWAEFEPVLKSTFFAADQETLDLLNDSI